MSFNIDPLHDCFNSEGDSDSVEIIKHDICLYCTLNLYIAMESYLVNPKHYTVLSGKVGSGVKKKNRGNIFFLY